MEKLKVHPLNFALRYNPPTLVMHYYLGEDQTQEFVHQINVFVKKNATSTKIVEELIRAEPEYFGEEVVPPSQLERLIQKIIDNHGNKIGHLKLKPVNPTKKPFQDAIPEKGSKEEILTSAPENKDNEGDNKLGAISNVNEQKDGNIRYFNNRRRR